MLAEVLADRGDWSQVMPGVRACLFSLEKSPLPLPLRLEPLHFEALFCVAGTVTLTRRDGSALTEVPPKSASSEDPCLCSKPASAQTPRRLISGGSL